MSSRDTVAVLGTGIMGAPMARNLLAAGFPVRVWNRTAEKAAPLAAAGAVVGASPEDAADGAQIVLTMLTDADAVLETAAPALAGAEVWIQASTVGIDGNERCAVLAAEHGVALVDAPVLGTRQPAEEGKLTVLASGPDQVRDRVDPVRASGTSSSPTPGCSRWSRGWPRRSGSPRASACRRSRSST
jgi:3-hydroxyisobutyrate dehydrogenase